MRRVLYCELEGLCVENRSMVESVSCLEKGIIL